MALTGSAEKQPCSGLCLSLQWCFVGLFFVITLPGTDSYCGRVEETAYSSPLKYNFPRSFLYSYTKHPYDKNLRCKVIFKPYYDGDGVKLKFNKLDLEPPRYPGDYNSCRDKIVVYDGEHSYDPVLTTLCGTRTTTVESTGSRLLLVFSSDNNNGPYRGYSVSYQRIDRGGSDSSSSLGPGTLTAIILPTILFYGCIFFLVYRRCKYASNVRRNLAATGHTPEDIRMALTTVMDQASRQPLSTTTANSSGQSQAGMNQILLEHMNASRDRRLERDSDGGVRTNPNRARHPAGEHNGRASPYYAPSLGVEDSPDMYGSRHGSPALYNPEGLTADHAYHHGQYIEDDRRSHGSGRSGRSHGHRNPSSRPHSHRDESPMAFTYYGNVDEATPAVDPRVEASAPSYEDVVQQPPPPSYEEAATGRYDPRPM